MVDHPSTSLGKLEEAWMIGRNTGLHYVYVGNLPSLLGGTTFCPRCEAVVMERKGWQTRRRTRAGFCPSCGTRLAGVWKE